MGLLREYVRAFLIENVGQLYYHGRDNTTNFAEGKPAFFVVDKQDAEWYALSRGSKTPTVHAARLAFSRPATLKDLMKVVADLKLNDDDLNAHTPNVGAGNINDYVYVPSVLKALEERGFDALETLDVLGNDEVPTVVVWHPSQIQIVGSDPVKKRQ